MQADNPPEQFKVAFRVSTTYHLFIGIFLSSTFILIWTFFMNAESDPFSVDLLVRGQPPRLIFRSLVKFYIDTVETSNIEPVNLKVKD